MLQRDRLAGVPDQPVEGEQITPAAQDASGQVTQPEMGVDDVAFAGRVDVDRPPKSARAMGANSGWTRIVGRGPLSMRARV